MSSEAYDKAKALTKDTLDTLFADVWNEESDPDLVESVSGDVAEQLILMAAAEGEKADEHYRNVQHLLATGVSVAASRYVLTAGKGLASFIVAVRTALAILLSAAIDNT